MPAGNDRLSFRGLDAGSSTSLAARRRDSARIYLQGETWVKVNSLFRGPVSVQLVLGLAELLARDRGSDQFNSLFRGPVSVQLVLDLAELLAESDIGLTPWRQTREP